MSHSAVLNCSVCRKESVASINGTQEYIICPYCQATYIYTPNGKIEKVK